MMNARLATQCSVLRKFEHECFFYNVFLKNMRVYIIDGRWRISPTIQKLFLEVTIVWYMRFIMKQNSFYVRIGSVFNSPTNTY